MQVVLASIYRFLDSLPNLPSCPLVIIAYKNYLGLSCFSQHLPSLFYLLPPAAGNAGDDLERAHEACHEDMFSGLPVHLPTAWYEIMNFDFVCP
jgi:hypothetical protein